MLQSCGKSLWFLMVRLGSVWTTQYFDDFPDVVAVLQQILRDGWKQELQTSLGLVMAFLATSLMSAPPRISSVSDEIIPVLIFTDGAYEPEGDDMQGSAGLVIIDAVDNFKVVQPVVVPDESHQHWKRGGSKQLIALMELWPVVVAIQCYGKKLYNRRCLNFIDNNAVRDGLTKGSSPLCDMFSLLSVVSLDVATFSLSMWFTRIPSKSNPADDPSRGRSSAMAKSLGAEELNPLAPSHDLVVGLQSHDSFITYMQKRSTSLVQPASLYENGGGGMLQGCNG